SGKLRVLAWTGAKRSPVLPNTPTMIEAGYPDVDLNIWQGIVAPVGIAPALVNKLNAEFIKAANAPEVLAKVAPQAVDILTSTPAEMAKLIASDVDRLGKVVRAAGIKAQ